MSFLFFTILRKIKTRARIFQFFIPLRHLYIYDIAYIYNVKDNNQYNVKDNVVCMWGTFSSCHFILCNTWQ